MNPDLISVLMLLGVCMVLFAINKPRMEVVALLMIAALTLSGVIDLSEALAGFSDQNVILIAALFVIGEALVRTGATRRVGNWLVKTAGQSEKRLLVLLMLTVAMLGSVMSSTGVVSVFIPVVLSITRRLKTPAARFMMPLGFAGLISGMLTLVATPPNLVVNGTLLQQTQTGFSFFSFTPIGLMVLLLGIGYMLIVQRWLDPKTADGSPYVPSPPRRDLAHYVQDYELQERGFRFKILPDSPLRHQSLESMGLRHRFGIHVIAVEKYGRFGRELRHPNAKTELRVGDALLVHFFHNVDVREFCEQLKLESLPLEGAYFSERSQEVGMAEVLIPPESPLIGKSAIEQSFRTRYDLSIVGLRRNGKAFDGSVMEERCKMGDIILVAGSWKAIRRLHGVVGDVVVLGLPPEVEEAAPASDKLPFAIAILLAMVVVMVGGWLPNVITALLACLLLGLFGCIDMPAAYKSIHWPSLILIAGMIPFAHALQTTGGVDLAVEQLVRFMDGAGSRLLLACLFVMTALTGLFISNTATAVLMAPVALGIATHLGYSPLPFAMTVAIACSAAFMTPVSSPVNTLVMGPGRYRFMDFVKVGVPFTLVVLVLTVLVVPWLFPFSPAQ